MLKRSAYTSENRWQRLPRGGFRISSNHSYAAATKVCRLCLARLKKSGGKDRRAPNNSEMKYGIIFPRNAKEAVQFDKENGNLLWQDAILK